MIGSITIALKQSVIPGPSGSVVRWDGALYQPEHLLSVAARPRIFRGWANPAKEGMALRVGDRWERDALADPPLVILDTDLSSDVDDCQDVKTCLVLHAEGKINLLGIVVSCTNPYGPAVVAAFQQYYLGSVAVPVASIYEDNHDYNPAATDPLYQYLYDHYPHPGYGLQDSGLPIVRARTAYRQWLASANKPVRIVATGLPGGILAAWSSAAGDDGVAATGQELMLGAVDRVYWTAGLFPTGYHRRQASAGASPSGVIGDNSWGPATEFNFVADAGGTQALLGTTLPITIPGIELVSGLTEPPNAAGTGPARSRIRPLGHDAYQAARRPSDDILAAAYTQRGGGREPWGMVGICCASIWREENAWGFGERFGTVSMDGFGVSMFAQDGGKLHRYVVLDPSQVPGITAQLNSLQAADCVQGAYTWNGTAWT